MPLKIGGTYVNKLSGPISMNILYPNVQHLYDFPNAPIFIIFGDSHFSNKNYCNPVEDEKNGHYIVDRGFLKLLSDAVNPDDIVDFYTEGGPFHLKDVDTSSTWPVNTPMHDIWIMFKKCYYNTRMKEMQTFDIQTYNKLKNIRWQSGDIRFFGDYDGYRIVGQIAPKIINESLILKENIRNRSFMSRFIGEILLSPYFDNYRFTVLEKRIDFINRILGRETSQSADKVMNEMINERTEKFDASFIHKQLKRINPKFDRLKQNLRSQFENYINDEYMKINRELNEKHELTYEKIQSDIIGLSLSMALYNTDQIDLYKKNILKHFNSGSLTDFLDKTTDIFTRISDLYILARSYKNMLKIFKAGEEVKYPLINVIYYGDYHANNLNNYLVKYGYENKLNIKIFINDPIIEREDKVIRCLNFGSHIDLDEMIGNLKTFRTNEGNARWLKMQPQL
jgi:hypothetical protein